MSGAFQSSFNSVDHTWSLCDGRAYRVIEEDWMGMQESVNTLENQHQSARQQKATLICQVFWLITRIRSCNIWA